MWVSADTTSSQRPVPDPGIFAPLVLFCWWNTTSKLGICSLWSRKAAKAEVASFFNFFFPALARASFPGSRCFTRQTQHMRGLESTGLPSPGTWRLEIARSPRPLASKRVCRSDWTTLFPHCSPPTPTKRRGLALCVCAFIQQFCCFCFPCCVFRRDGAVCPCVLVRHSIDPPMVLTVGRIRNVRRGATFGFAAVGPDSRQTITGTKYHNKIITKRRLDSCDTAYVYRDSCSSCAVVLGARSLGECGRACSVCWYFRTRISGPFAADKYEVLVCAINNYG
ncbi:hypothetical protein B0J18DRAFT_291735 [Chaetomium sp. MPI-SDFR-AT-0129]|nr:hypothetical protein B0J18DRAFT_291735 [Chaetomium sp. MPI-SDFR-AT-0129]